MRDAVLHRVKGDRDILHTTKRRNANWIGYILRRNCFLEHVTEGKMKVTVRRGKEVSSYWMMLKKREDTEC